MMSRRKLLAGGLVLAAVETPVNAAAAAGGQGEAVLEEILREVRGIHVAVESQGAAAVAKIRESRRAFLKNTAKFPEFVDVGVNVFEATIDWLMSLQQPVAVTRLPDGRYTVPLLGTTVVLRPDYPDDHVGQGYDK